MLRSPHVTAAILLATGLLSVPQAAAYTAVCPDLAALQLPDAVVTAASLVTSGAFTPLGGTPLTGLPVFCRVEGVSRPTADSEIGFEVWIPQDERWNGKFLQVGMIAYAGTFEYRAMAPFVQRGYAVAATDGGHKGVPYANASWALGHPEKIIDWGYRAHKQTTDHAKAIIRGYTARDPSRSYFYGASTGGRDALMVAQRNPQDFDGIIVDGPALFWTHLAAAWLWTEQALFTDPASWIPPTKLPAIQSAVLAACDGLDGLADGIVSDPRDCRFDPGVLQCVGADVPGCLTAPQVTALGKIIDGPKNPRTGARISSGYGVAAAAADSSWAVSITGPEPSMPLSEHAFLGNSFFANMVNDVGDAAYDFRAFDLDRDVPLADNRMIHGETLAAVVNATDPNLAGLKARGGRIIMYTGWEDPIIPPRNVIDYYESVIAAQGPAAGRKAVSRTRDFFRFFLVPGMSHFSGGTGPDSFGSPYGQPGLQVDRQHDVLSALEAWVELGIAPESIVAAKYVNGNPALGVARTRPICAYPQIARWTGTGNPDEAVNFVCVDSRRGSYPD